MLRGGPGDRHSREPFPLDGFGGEVTSWKYPGPRRSSIRRRSSGTISSLDSRRFHVDSAAIAQTKHQLQAAVARISAYDFPDFRQNVLAMQRLIHSDDDTTGIARVELIDRDQFVHNQIRFVSTARDRQRRGQSESHRIGPGDRI